jgi:hypothetical protein
MGSLTTLPVPLKKKKLALLLSCVSISEASKKLRSLKITVISILKIKKLH